MGRDFSAIVFKAWNCPRWCFGMGNLLVGETLDLIPQDHSICLFEPFLQGGTSNNLIAKENYT